MKRILFILSVIILFVACDDMDVGGGILREREDDLDIIREEPFNKIAFDSSRKVTYEGLNFVVPVGMKGEEDRFDREYEMRVYGGEIITIDNRPDRLPVNKKDIKLGVYYVEDDGDLVAYYTKDGQTFEIEYDNEKGNYKESYIKVLSSIIDLN